MKFVDDDDDDKENTPLAWASTDVNAIAYYLE